MDTIYSIQLRQRRDTLHTNVEEAREASLAKVKPITNTYDFRLRFRRTRIGCTPSNERRAFLPMASLVYSYYYYCYSLELREEGEERRRLEEIIGFTAKK